MSLIFSAMLALGDALSGGEALPRFELNGRTEHHRCVYFIVKLFSQLHAKNVFPLHIKSNLEYYPLAGQKRITYSVIQKEVGCDSRQRVTLSGRECQPCNFGLDLFRLRGPKETGFATRSAVYPVSPSELASWRLPKVHHNRMNSEKGVFGDFYNCRRHTQITAHLRFTNAPRFRYCVFSSLRGVLRIKGSSGGGGQRVKADDQAKDGRLRLPFSDPNCGSSSVSRPGLLLKIVGLNAVLLCGLFTGFALTRAFRVGSETINLRWLAASAAGLVLGVSCLLPTVIW